MKVMLGNGWYQEVTLNKKGEEVTRYMKDEKEYSREQWVRSKVTTGSTVKESLFSKVRRKLANKIDPTREPSHEYGVAELNWMSDEKQNEVALASNHKLFEKENGRKATSDDEAVNFTRKYLDRLNAGKKNE